MDGGNTFIEPAPHHLHPLPEWRANYRRGQGSPKARLANGSRPLSFSGEEIIRRTAAAFGLTVEQLRSPRRHRKFTEPRFAAYWLLRKHLTGGGRQRSFPEIGRLIGGKDHSSVMHGIARVPDIAARDPDYAARLRALDEGREVYGPPRPLDRKDRPPVWNTREQAIVARVKPVACNRDEPEPSELAHKAAMRRGSFALEMALRGALAA